MKLGDQKQLESVRGKKSNKYSENWSATIGFPRDNRIMEEIWLQNKKESSDKERDEYSTEKKDKIDGNITLQDNIDHFTVSTQIFNNLTTVSIHRKDI